MKEAVKNATLEYIKETKRPEDHKGERIYLEVTFRGNKRMYYMVSRGAGIRVNDCVIADVEKGHDIGHVTCSGRLAEIKHGPTDGHNIIRKATEQDLQKFEKIIQDEKASFDICREKVHYYRMEMNLAEAEKQFDESKMTFYFLAEQRVDFRELVKDLAGTFKTRIELRQIGVRDEARRLSGVGVCGRALCCANHLAAFEQISTQMARTQHLSLNQSKLSGNCGRLKCCLKYELDFYEKMNHALPQPGSRVKTPKGDAVVASVNIMKSQVKLRYTETGSEEVLSHEDFLVATGKAQPKPAEALPVEAASAETETLPDPAETTP
ncbi:MAG: regulatory iron-sulfur-containing complex subunit RicT [Fibrobacterota bacterium]